MTRVGEAASTQARLPAITIRGHHLLGLRDFLRKMPTPEEFFRESTKSPYTLMPRYGVDFYINYFSLFEQIAAGDAVIRISGSLDDLCKPCFNKTPSCGKSFFSEFVSAKALGFNLQEYQAAEIADKLKNGQEAFTTLF